MAKKFTEMTKSEAIAVLMEAATRWNQTFVGWKVESRVTNLAWKWNRENGEEKGDIDIYPLWNNDFNEGRDYGIGIEDDYIIYKECEDEWNQFTERQFSGIELPFN